MNGIDVLNKIELTDVVTNKTLETIIVIFLILVILSFGVTVIVVLSEACLKTSLICMCSTIIITLIGIIFTILSDLSSKEIPNGKYEYQVTISDSVSMVEFNEKYEMIKVEGKIYTIREKDGE